MWVKNLSDNSNVPFYEKIGIIFIIKLKKFNSEILLEILSKNGF